MANATKIERVEVVFTGVTLELSIEEAEAIFTLVGNVGGGFHNPQRDIVNGIYDSLAEALDMQGGGNKSDFAKSLTKAVLVLKDGIS